MNILAETDRRNQDLDAKFQLRRMGALRDEEMAGQEAVDKEEGANGDALQRQPTPQPAWETQEAANEEDEDTSANQAASTESVKKLKWEHFVTAWPNGTRTATVLQWQRDKATGKKGPGTAYSAGVPLMCPVCGKDMVYRLFTNHIAARPFCKAAAVHTIV